MIIAVLLATLMTSGVQGDFDCVCNLNDVDTPVYLRPTSSLQPEGYMQESTCKPVYRLHGNISELYYEIQFERKVAYVEKQANVDVNQCQGEPSLHDLVPTSTAQPSNTFTTFATKGAFTMRPTSTPTTMMSTSTSTPTTMTSTSTSTTTPTTMTSTSTSTTTPTTMTSTSTSTSTPTTMMSTSTSTSTPTTMMSTSTSTPTTMTSTSTTTTTPTTMMPITTPTTMTPKTTPTSIPPTTIPAAPYMSPVGTLYETIGVGYTLLTGTPDQSKDIGITARRIFQVTGNNAIGEVNHRQYHTCKSESSTFLVHSSRTYQKELLNYVTPSSRHPSNLMNEALAYSSGFASVKHAVEINRPETVYTDIKSTCITDELSADLNYTQVTAEFATALCSLPLDITSDTTAYMRFIDTWGTSMVTDASIGHGTVVRHSLDLQKIFQMLRQKSASTQNGGPLKGYSSSLLTTPSQVQGLHNVGSQMHTTTIGSQTNHQPLQLKIVPIFQALDSKYWDPVMGQLAASRICPGGFERTMLAKYQANLNETLSLYTGYYHTKIGYIRTATDHPLQIPVTWPLGKYGLMQAASGCPGASTLWQAGWRKQDTEDTSPGNRFTSGINQYLSVEFNNQNIQTSYCIRNAASYTGYDIDWPKGNYCILKKGGTCPVGFRSGSIFWDDEDELNSNDHGGALPDGNYDKDTRIYYCCRNDGPSTTEIILPVDRPFVLMRYTSTCQRVHGMTSRDLHVRWDDEDDSNVDKHEGATPLDTGGSHDHDLFFCHYHRSAGVPIIG